MKLASFLSAGRSSYGAVTDNGVIDLGAMADMPKSLRQAIAELGTKGLRKACDNKSVDHDCSDISWVAPITDPQKIICIGINYINRNEEYLADSTQPSYPSVFMRTPASLVGHRQPIVRPLDSEQFDYEGEIGIVIGATGRRIPQAQAEDYIAGLTCVQEGSVRDWMRHGKFNVTQGKNFDKSGAIGPWIVTAEEFDNYEQLTVITRVNGQQRQHDTTANLLFSFRYLISYLSTFMTLYPGDIISTGTPTGAGARFDPPKYLLPGDTVEVEVGGVGILANSVVDE